VGARLHSPGERGCCRGHRRMVAVPVRDVRRCRLPWRALPVGDRPRSCQARGGGSRDRTGRIAHGRPLLRAASGGRILSLFLRRRGRDRLARGPSGRRTDGLCGGGVCLRDRVRRIAARAGCRIRGVAGFEPPADGVHACGLRDRRVRSRRHRAALGRARDVRTQPRMVGRRNQFSAHQRGVGTAPPCRGHRELRRAAAAGRRDWEWRWQVLSACRSG
jgi:hypothetical protein